MLLADDSPLVRGVLVKRLREVGLEPIVKDSAASARLVDAGEVSCALLDLDLADGTGVEVATALRARDAALPVAFFSAGAPAGVSAAANALGPVFHKPADVERAIAWVISHA